MNPLTNVKNIKKLSEQELRRGDKTSWHDQYKDSAWIFIGGLPFDLTEGDILTVFSQYGEIADVNLVRDKDTGKSRGFAFLCYADQRSTILAVDNFNGMKLMNRTIRVDHVTDYKPPKSPKRGKKDDENEPIQETEEKNISIPITVVAGENSTNKRVKVKKEKKKKVKKHKKKRESSDESSEEEKRKKKKSNNKKKKKKQKKEETSSSSSASSSSSSESDSSSSTTSEDESRTKVEPVKKKYGPVFTSKSLVIKQEPVDESNIGLENRSHRNQSPPRIRNILSPRRRMKEETGSNRSPVRQVRRRDISPYKRQTPDTGHHSKKSPDGRQQSTRSRERRDFSPIRNRSPDRRRSPPNWKFSPARNETASRKRSPDRKIRSPYEKKAKRSTSPRDRSPYRRRDREKWSPPSNKHVTGKYSPRSRR